MSLTHAACCLAAACRLLPAPAHCVQGRGAASGWEYTVGLIAANDDDYAKTNRRAVPARKGVAELQVDVVDSGKEIGGTFRMLQVKHCAREACETSSMLGCHPRQGLPGACYCRCCDRVTFLSSSSSRRKFLQVSMCIPAHDGPLTEGYYNIYGWP